MPNAPKRDPLALSIADLAHVLRKAGSQRASAETIRESLAAGAPANGDGTINLIQYAAWLIRAAGK